MSAPPLLTERHGHVLLVTLNRPEALNAVDSAVTAALGRTVQEADDDPDVRALVLTGAGARAFCAGADLKEMADPARATSSGGPREWGFAGYVRHHVSIPTIAAVNGLALGGGTELVLASDLAIASTDAQFGLPEVTRGFFAGGGGAFRLAQQIPRKVAMDLLLTGGRLDARRAYEVGLVSRVVEPQELLGAALALAAEIVANAPLAVQASKRIALGVVDGQVPAETPFWDADASEGQRIRGSVDAAEGPRAFAERRPAQWVGR